ncbi:protein mono-ADP-ribosyltransferase PARP14-like [Saccostrea echinata]|uniref:protein mono-ADP-ribosyltransferase PARP14-like n=1 Tax=Saccostrea echinata TaxID=191078 RepID=UPI002A823858|nr:protein mono-ADP-ribosyltransferase PARP14-like [Saccostrea echinata]
MEASPVVKRVLQKHESTPLMMNKQQIEVEEYHPPQEDSDGISEGLNEKRTIKVTKLPTGISEEQIALFFENYKKSGGGEVEKVEYDENTNTAIVWFEEAQVVKSVLQKHESTPLMMNKQQIEVEEYHPPQEDSDGISEGLNEKRTIKVTKLPTGISEEQIALFFENYKKSGGGEVEKVEYDENTNTAIVWFEDAQVVASVLQKQESSTLTMNKQKIDVEEYHPPQEDSDRKFEGLDEGRTIKVTKLPTGISEEQIALFFENYKKSGGGEVEKVEYDEDIDTAIVWFEDAQVVTSVLQKHAGTPLTINKQKIDVEEYHPCKEEVENSSEVEQYQGGAIKITKLPPGTSEEQILLFFENRKMSGGGEVVKVEYNKNTDSAIVWFEDADVVSRVLQRIPLLFNKKQIYVEEVRLDGKSVEKEAEEDTLGPLCTIEVRGMKETTSRENIELYFDNKKKSGGGGVEDVKGEVEDGVLYITFENEKNVEEVMKQEHKVDGVILDVKIYHPPKPIPVYPDRVLITGFKTGTTKDGLTNFLEARTGEDVKEVVFDQEQEMAIIIFQEIKDFLKLEEICQKKPLEKHFLSVKKVSISNCIIVTGFAENTAESTIEFYFDNERRSGGGVVTEVKINKDDDTCLVYFEDHTVCDRVCQKGHMLENMKLTVHTFYECLGPPFNPEEGPKFRPVEPLVVKNLNLRKMKFVLSSEEYRKVFDKQAESNHGKIKWPSKAATELTVECTLSKEVKDCRKLAKTWKDHMVDVIKKLLEVLHVEAVNVLQEAWQKSLEEIQKLNVPDPRKVGIITEKSNFTIVIVGYEKLFEGVKSEVRLTISKVVDEIQLKKKLVKERVPLKRYQLLLLSNDNFTEATEKEFPNMKVTLDIQDKSVTFDGLYSDVSKAKLSVLEKCQQMCQASAGKFSKNRQEFLSRNEVYARISKELKNKKNLSCFEFQKDELMFYAFSDDKAVEAAHLVKNYIAESPIDVQTDSVYLLNSEKWKKQVKKLESSQDFEGLLQIITEADQRKIVIVTVSEYVGLAREFVEDFLRDNTIISDTMDIPPSLSKFMELHHAGKLEQISESLKEQQVRIKKNNNKIDIEGTQKGLNRAKKNIEDFLKGIQWKKQKLERPGIAKHLKSSSGKSKISEVQKNHKCYIQIGEDGSTDLSNFWTATSNSKQKQDSNKRMTGYLTKEGVSIKVHSGDLTALPVDVIVNAANSELYHQGGLAGVIVTKGGNEIQIECSDYVRRKGKLFEGDTFCSKAGQLSCKMIVHACGPTWRGGMNQESERLTDCVESALTETEKMGYNSIAIPGLCTGIFGYPVNQATSVIVKAMKSYLKNRKGSTIEEIILCDVREETVKYFNEAVKQEFKGKIQNVGDSAHAHFQDGQTQSHDTEFKTGGIRVKLVKGQMAQRKVDIIVNTAAKDLNLSQGAVSASLLNLGGIDIQRECHSKYPHGIEFGDIAVTSGGKLNCKNIFHGALQNWDKEKGVAKTGLQKFMKTCLTEVQNMKFSSIAFPAFGTGNLGYPKDIVADEMCNAVVNFSKDNPDTCLKNVEFVIYEKDKVSIQIFEKEMSSRAKEVIQVKIKTQRKRHGGEHVGKTFGSDSQKEVSVDFGPIKLRMYQGDITLADVDAIVNGTDSEMDLSKGEVSRTIMSKLGVELQRQIDIQS